MPRGRKQEEPENHERWMISYADFITLLFAFFVVMYSVSSVNEGKYRVLSQSMAAAFRSPEKSLQPIQIGNLMRMPPNPVDIPKVQRPPARKLVNLKFMPPPLSRPAPTGNQVLEAARKQVDTIAKEVEVALQQLISQGLVTVRRKRFWLEVEIQTNILFDSGSSQLSKQAVPILKRLGTILRDFPNPIQVEGFTDNVPINTLAFPSNWELSAARAATVVRLFAQYEVDPRRMASVGLGEYRPIVKNDTLEGRSKNRRVVIVVMAKVATTVEKSLTEFDLLRFQIEQLALLSDKTQDSEPIEEFPVDTQKYAVEKSESSADKAASIGGAMSSLGKSTNNESANSPATH